MTDLDKAIAAAREALEGGGPVTITRTRMALESLLAAIDAAKKEAEMTDNFHNQLRALADSLEETWDSMDGVSNPFLVLAHTAIRWFNNGRPPKAPPAAAHDGLRNAEQTLALLIRKYGDEADAAALAMLAAAERKGEP